MNYTIQAPHFYILIQVELNICVNAPPLVQWMEGKSIYEIKKYCETKKWIIAENHEHQNPT